MEILIFSTHLTIIDVIKERLEKECNKHGIQLHAIYTQKRIRKDNSVYQIERVRCLECFRESTRKRCRKRKEKMVTFKGGKCQECGYNKCLAALDFHHRDPKEKEKNLNRLSSWNKILIELAKCDLLCVRCHRELEYLKWGE